MKYYEAYFINPAIESGIRNYKRFNEVGEYNRGHIFEMNVIKCLTIIYGEKAIMLPYKIDNEKAFECNLLIYGLSIQDMKNFLKYMGEYDTFIKTFNKTVSPSGIISEIEKILIQMIDKRSKYKPFTESEIKEFDSVFNPIGGDLKKLKTFLSKDEGLIIRAWEENKLEFTNTQINLMKVNPTLLTPDRYEKFGFNIKEIALLSNDKIEKINKRIIQEENHDYLKYQTKETKKRFALLNATGFVYTLLSISIVSAIALIMAFIMHIGG